MDAISAEEVTITPADRSNSPPIINSATDTAMMPIDALEYRTVENDDARRNASAIREKKTNNTTAPTSEPISGRPSSLRNDERAARRSSPAGVAGAMV